LVAAAAVATQCIDYGVFNLRFRFLDMDTHASVFGVVSLMALVAATGIALVNARSAPVSARRRFLLPALLFGLLVLRLLHPVDVLLIALPVAVITLALLWSSAERRTDRARALVRTGCVFLVCSYFTHLFDTTVLSTSNRDAIDSWPIQVELMVRHVSELVGWALVAAGYWESYLSRPRCLDANPEVPEPARRRQSLRAPRPE
jgi:hypothetical protein